MANYERQVELLIRTTVGDEYLNPLLVTRMAELVESTAASARAEGVKEGEQRALRLRDELQSEMDRRWEALPEK